MPEFSGLGKLMMIAGAVLLVTGFLVFLGDRIPFPGKLPGDIFIQLKGFGLYFPVITCVVVSLVLTVILNVISRK